MCYIYTQWDKCNVIVHCLLEIAVAPAVNMQQVFTEHVINAEYRQIDVVLPYLLEVAVAPAPNMQQVFTPLQADLPRACHLTHAKFVQSPL